MKSRIILNKRTYDRMVRRGEIEERPYLKIRWYPSLSIDNYRYVGLDDSSLDEKYRVMKIKKGLISYQNECYIGEAFIRLASLIGYSAKWGGKQYKVLHYGSEEEERAAYWVPNPRVLGMMQNVFRRANVIPENFHEFLFHIYRRPLDGEYEFMPYFRDEDFPEPDYFDGKNIIRREGERPEQIKINAQKHRTRCPLWRREDIISTVQFIKGVLIPLEKKKPTKSLYISWFMEYGGVKRKEAEDMYKHRSEVRLV